MHYSADGWCGGSDAHCKCKGCVDFRIVQVDGAGDSSDEDDHTTPKTIGKTTPEPKNKKTKGQAVKVRIVMGVRTQYELSETALYAANDLYW